MSRSLGLRSCGVALTIWLLLAGGGTAQEASSAPASLDELAWMVGTWGDEEALEHWTDGAGGLMLGVHRDLRDGRAVFFEFLRIARAADGRLVYLASPGGRMPPTVFEAESVEANRVVFTNPEHDFPQRIEYRLDASSGDLLVRAETIDGQRAVSWRWPRRPGD